MLVILTAQGGSSVSCEARASSPEALAKGAARRARAVMEYFMFVSFWH